VLLDDKIAVVYGGGGSIGGAVARAFAREGATVHLAGRTAESLDRVADDIRAAGGTAYTAVVDALDEPDVEAHATSVIASSGRIDISFNVITHGDVQGTPMVEMTPDDYLQPVINGVRTNFLTARAAARDMIRHRSGVILVFGGYGDPQRDYYLGGLQTGFQAIEAMRRQLAAELGKHGIRVLTLQSAGIPESLPVDFEGRDAITEGTEAGALLGRAATLADVGNVAAFAASDSARSMTATALNITCGAFVD
jgi:NAD(P)-dependent dehydrogenase (short-subunit alcohol dehydrogenase family)